MTPLIWLVAMSLPLRGDGRPLPYYYPQAAVLIHDFRAAFPFRSAGVPPALWHAEGGTPSASQTATLLTCAAKRRRAAT